MIISGYTPETKDHQSKARSYVPYQFSNSNIEPKKKELFSLIPFYKKKHTNTKCFVIKVPIPHYKYLYLNPT